MLTKRYRPLNVFMLPLVYGELTIQASGLRRDQLAILLAVQELTRETNQICFRDQIKAFCPFFSLQRISDVVHELKELGYTETTGNGYSLTHSGEMFYKSLEIKMNQIIAEKKASFKWTNQNKNQKVKALMFPAIRKGTKLL